MKKYYDQIVSLIKEHRKYPGCEDILEDIVEDVYAHADVVLNSVTNESVISSYLSKIVSTSMVTVPKRLGITTSRPKSTDAETLIEEMTVSVSNAEAETDETYSDKDESLTDITENDYADKNKLTSQETIYEDTDELELPEQENSELQELTDIDLNEEVLEQEPVEEIIEEESDDVPNEEQEQEAEDESEINKPNQSNIITDKNEPEVDKTLVDKMINGIASDENSVIQEELVNEDLEEEASDEIIALPEDKPTETEEIAELNLNIDDKPVEEEMLASPEQEELLIEDEEVSELSDDFAESLENEETENTEEIIEQLDTEEYEPIDYKGNTTSGLSAYNAFVFTPKSEEFDLSEVLPEIDALASKYPDLKVLEVFKLKYYEKLSVSEIAKQLEKTDADILKTLNELMYLVKE